jgi:uncharacterized damage-inducible protein DinB
MFQDNGKFQMIGTQHVKTMAAYNKWQNTSLYSAAETLDDAARQLDRGSFFTSIHDTLNHILWGDRMWMSRFAGTPKPVQPNFAASVQEGGAWAGLMTARTAMDAEIKNWAAILDNKTLASNLSWFSGALQADVSKPMWFCVTHFFNHQTHHRGQVHAMLTAAGARPDDTDLFIMSESYLD